MALAVAGCSSTTSAPPQAAPDQAPSVVPGGSAIVASDTEPTGFNNRTARGNTTAVRTVMRRVWPTVWTVTPNFENQLETDFVLSAESSGRDVVPQTIVYRINPAAIWSDGTSMSADDFIYNWEVGKAGAVDVDGKPISSVAPGENAIQSITGSPDGDTVSVVLRQPMAEWKSLFTKPIVPAHVAKRVGWNTGFDNPANVVSGGPFKIAGYNPGRDLTLARNEQFWGKPATLDSVTFNFVKDSAAAVTALRSGEVHVIAPRAQVDLLDQLQNRDGITVVASTGFEAEFLDFNLRNEFLADQRVRQAFALALDRTAIVARSARQINKDAAVMQHRLLPAEYPGYADTSANRYTGRDVPQAKRLLEAAGFTMGADGYYEKGPAKKLELRITAATGDALRAAQEELIQSQVKDAGIMLRIDNAPSDNTAGGLSTRLQSGDFDVANLSQGMATSPTTTSASFTTTGTVNISKYSNTTVDRLYQEAASELDDKRRTDLLNQIDRQLWEDMPRLPLYQRPTVVAFQSSLANVGINPVSGPFWNIDQWGRKA
ncbi:MAG: ABC transporter family substrate-binding protein [Acidimicrobiales bacterium]